MSIAFVTGSAAYNNSGLTSTPAPASIVAGNLLLAFVGVSSGSSTCTGWTVIGTSSASNPHLVLLYKWATGSEPSTYAFTGGAFAATILQYSGVSSTSPVDVSAFANGSSSPASLPAVTTTAPGDLVVTGVFDQFGNAASTPSGLTLRESARGNISLYVWDVAAPSAGTAGPWSTALSGGPGVFDATASVALFATPTSTPATATGALTLTGTVTVTIPAAASGVLTLAGTATGTPMFTLSAIVSGPNVNLSWTAVGASYAIERDGNIVAFGVTGTTYTDTPGSGAHSYRVGVLA